MISTLHFKLVIGFYHSVLAKDWFKSYSWRSFSKYIGLLELCKNVGQFNPSIFNLWLDKILINPQVWHLVMFDWIVEYVDGWFIVVVQPCWCRQRHFQIINLSIHITSQIPWVIALYSSVFCWAFVTYACFCLFDCSFLGGLPWSFQDVYCL